MRYLSCFLTKSGKESYLVDFLPDFMRTISRLPVNVDSKIMLTVFFILGLAASNIETVFELLDGFFNINTDFVDAVPFC